ncbi:MAG: sialate O-acetylesterase [Ruminococcaceae bacterium]|nr:sialate O-acetylesterase [Oscillospiraceae bacterium]
MPQSFEAFFFLKTLGGIKVNAKNTQERVEYSVSKTIGSNMVVQRNSAFNVFGKSKNKGAVIYAEFAGEKNCATVDENGKWCVQFSTGEATKTEQTLKIYAENGVATEFSGILIGDVWVVSGQSNAELNFCVAAVKTPEYQKEINEKDNIRVFSQAREDVMSVKDKEDITIAREDVINENYAWKKTTVSDVQPFSALGYYFAKELSRTVDVPLGMIMAAAGGSTLHELMPAEVAAECGFTEAPSVPVCGFYNSLLHPFTNNSIKGMIYYQGESESNAGSYKKYAGNLKKTVEGYRKAWGMDFPFINVQLTTHMGESVTGWNELPNIRAAQFNAYKEIENSYLVVSRDQNYKEEDPDWAHPYYKFEIGKRAAAIAASAIYGKCDMEYSASPEPVKVTWQDDFVFVDFRYVGDGLKLLDGEKLKGFAVLNEAGDDILTCAEIADKSTVKLKFSGKGEKVQYCMFHNGIIELANLGNSGNFPAPAFEILK